VKPYFTNGSVRLYLGDCREVLPALALEADVVIADPPYGETSLAWDRWPDGWPAVVRDVTRQLWCFGSMRMFLDRRDEFAGWNLAQDVVWEKHNGTGFAADRFKRVHELAVQFYRGPWADLYREPQRVPYDGPDKHARARRSRTPHAGEIGPHHYDDDGTRLVRSVIRAPSVRGEEGRGTTKPAAILCPLIAYSCPPGGLVLDPMAGSGSTLAAARELGRCAVGIEIDEQAAETAARRLSQGDLFDAEPGGGEAA
jgi:site-specific DNA-methyltransferase (adenine-specific)